MPRLVLLAAAALSLTAPLASALTVSEASGSSYEPCTTAELTPLAAKITTESNDCAAKSSYDWNSAFLPTNDQRKELCSCTSLIRKLQTVTVPHCGFFRTNYETFASGLYSYKNIAEYAFGLCSSSGSSATTTTTTTTSAPTKTTAPPYVVPTYSPYTYTPVAAVTYAPSFDLDTSTSSSTKKSKSKTGVTVGVIIGVVAVGAIAGFVGYKRKQKHAARDSNSASSHAEVDVEAGTVENDGEQEELSPLGGDGGNDATYASMPASPLGQTAQA